MTEPSDKPQSPVGTGSSAGHRSRQAAVAQGAGLRRVTVTGSGASEGDERPSGSRSLTGREQGAVDPYIGCTVDGRYQVEKILGEGGMGVVYRCKHTIIGKKVAMKVLRADLARNMEVTERFLNEAKSASSIGNPHIIDISDFGRLPDGSTYFIMEYLDGETLSAVVDAAGPVAIERIVHIAEQLAEGLYAAHEAGIIHRDLKPDNIFLISRGGREFVKILDFGIAKASSTDGKLTQAGQVFGTPHYMSPEQAAGSPLDHRADIYSTGVILYEMASGKVPFDAENFMGILTQHMYKAPVPIRALVPIPQDVPPGLEAIILKCLSKRPEQRYPTMRALHDDLLRLREGNLPEAVTDLMHRASGPHDLLGAGKLRAWLTATPSAGRSQWPLYAALGGVAAAAALVVAIFAQGASSDAVPAAEALTAKAPPAPPAVSAAAPPTPTPEPATVERHQVVLAVAPLDAHVFHGAEDLGTSPVLVEVAEGERLELTAKRAGYKDAEVTVDGTQKKHSIALEALAPAPRTPARKDVAPTPTRDKPAAKTSTSGIVNPWE